MMMISFLYFTHIICPGKEGAKKAALCERAAIAFLTVLVPL
jgi:hypothetical protein